MAGTVHLIILWSAAVQSAAIAGEVAKLLAAEKFSLIAVGEISREILQRGIPGTCAPPGDAAREKMQ